MAFIYLSISMIKTLINVGNNFIATHQAPGVGSGLQYDYGLRVEYRRPLRILKKCHIFRFVEATERTRFIYTTLVGYFATFIRGTAVHCGVPA